MISLFTVSFLGALDHTVVATSLATIAGDLGAVEQMSWVIVSYTLASTVVLPVLGKLADLIGARFIFLSSLVLFLIASLLCGFAQDMTQLALAVVAVPHIAGRSGRRFDIAGALTLGVTVTALVLAASWVSGGTAGTAVVVAALVAIVGLVAFIAIELRVAEPLVPLRHFANRTVLITIILSTVIGVGLFSVVSYVPTYIQMAYRTSATVSGLVPIATVFGMLVSTLLTGWLSSRSGRYRVFPIFGTAIAAVGLLIMALLPAGMPLWVPMAAMGLVGIGTGSFMNIIVAVAQSAASRSDTGSVTATLSLVRQVGSTTATAIVGGLIGAGVAAGLPAALDATALTPQAVHAASAAVQTEVATLYSSVLAPIFLGLAVAYAVGIVAAVLLPNGRLSDELEPLSAAEHAAETATA